MLHRRLSEIGNVFLVLISAHLVDCITLTQVLGKTNLRVNDIFALRCSVDLFAANIVIEDPLANTVSCVPSGFLPASCLGTPGYTVNETEKTVTMEKNASLSDDGQWTCIYFSSPQLYSSHNITVLKFDKIPALQQNIKLESSAMNGATIKKNSNDTFTVVFGCISKKVEVKWELSASLSSWVTATTSSSKYSCTTNTQLYSATVSAADVFTHFHYGTTTLRARVVYSAEELAYAEFDVIFDGGTRCEEFFILLILPIDVIALIVLLYKMIKKIQKMNYVQIENMTKKCCEKWFYIPVCVVMLVIKVIQAFIVVPILISIYECPAGPAIGIAAALIVGCPLIYLLICWIVILVLIYRKFSAKKIASEGDDTSTQFDNYTCLRIRLGNYQRVSKGIN